MLCLSNKCLEKRYICSRVSLFNSVISVTWKQVTQKFIMLEVYIKYWGVCDVLRVKSIFKTNLARGKMTCDLLQAISVFSA